MDACEALQDDAVLRRAIWRYEHCWVPLLLDHVRCTKKGKLPLVAPLDVAWIWLVHLLHPLSYSQVSAAPLPGTLLSVFQGLL